MSEFLIALFALFVFCTGKFQTRGGAAPDEARRREMDRLYEERFGG